MRIIEMTLDDDFVKEVKRLSQLEALSVVEARRAKKDISALRAKVTAMLDAVPKNKKVPEWDAVQHIGYDS